MAWLNFQQQYLYNNATDGEADGEINSINQPRAIFYSKDFFDDYYYTNDLTKFYDGELWDGEARDAFYNKYTQNGRYNFYDSYHYNYVLNSFTNWAIANASQFTLWKVTGPRNFYQCIVQNFLPICFACKEVVEDTGPVVVDNNNSTANETNTTNTNTTTN